MRLLTLLLLSLLLVISGCTTPQQTLSVDVVTDLTPGREFDRAEVKLFVAGSSRRINSEELRTIGFTADYGDAASFSRGRRLADFAGVANGPYVVRVRLYRPSGAVLAERWSSVVVRDSTRVAIGLDAACVSVMCPAPGGSPAFTECARGQCVDANCTPDNPEGWAEHCCDPLDPNRDCSGGGVIYCRVDDECGPAQGECAAMSCAEGLCLQVPRADACPSGDFCAREEGCLPLPIRGDAGMLDAGMGVDAGGCVDLDRDRWCASEDCDDNDRNTFEGAAELCDSQDNDCDGNMDEGVIALPWYDDRDGDGFGATSAPVFSCAPVEGRSLVSSDCDPSDPNVFPGAPEVCDGLRTDCLSVGEPRDEDLDGDGHASPSASCDGGFPRNDCDDSSASRHPGAPERCDGMDNDCDTRTDEDVSPLPVYADDDNDGFTGPRIASMSCLGGVLPGGDCNDADGTVYPGALERCDLIDSDCNMNLDDAPAGSITGTVGVCAARSIPLGCVAGVVTPDYASIPNWQMTETRCDRLDNDCDGVADEGAMLVDAYVDADGDGYGAWDDYADTQRTVRACPGAPNTSLVGHDIDDMNPLSNPGRIETCSGIDDDGNGVVDGPGLCPAGQLCAAGSCRPCSVVGPVVGGAITGAQVWCASAGTISVTSALVIVPGASLTIEGGVRLNFAAGTGITVRGSLEAAGTVATPVTFSAETPTRGFWEGIAGTGEMATSIRLQGARLEYASVGLFASASVTRLSRVTIRETSAAILSDLRADYRDVVIEDCDSVLGDFAGRFLRTTIRRCATLAGEYVEFVDSSVVDNGELSTTSLTARRTLIARSSRVTSGPAHFWTLAESTYADNGGPLPRGATVRSTLCRNGPYDVDMRTIGGAATDYANNYWCTTSATAIAARIYDFSDDPRLGTVDFTPFLLAPSPTAPPIP